MKKLPPFDATQAHVYFASSCFNATWNLIRKQRTSEEERTMLDLAHASFWHWGQRSDCSKRNRSIGYWLLARVHALAGDAKRARQYGELSLTTADEVEPFYRGFAYEALARAEMVARNWARMKKHLQTAETLAKEIKEVDDAAWLRENLADISRPNQG